MDTQERLTTRQRRRKTADGTKRLNSAVMRESYTKLQAIAAAEGLPFGSALDKLIDREWERRVKRMNEAIACRS